MPSPPLLLLGGWSSCQSVVHLHRTATEADRSIWSYYPDEYALPDTYVSPTNHLTISINERYERVALQGDQLYCFGEAAEQALMETIAATDATERHTPGSLAHRHRKFYAVTLARTGRYDEALEREQRIAQVLDELQVKAPPPEADSALGSS